MNERIRCRIDNCGQAILPADYRTHAHIAHQVPIASCGGCRATFWTLAGLRAHGRQVHAGRWRARYQQTITRVLLRGRRRPERPAPPIEEPRPLPPTPPARLAASLTWTEERLAARAAAPQRHHEPHAAFGASAAGRLPSRMAPSEPEPPRRPLPMRGRIEGPGVPPLLDGLPGKRR